MYIIFFIMNRFFKYDVISTSTWWKLTWNFTLFSRCQFHFVMKPFMLMFISLPIINPQTQQDGPACCTFLLIVLPASHLWSAHSFGYVPLSICQCCFPCSSWVMSLIAAPGGGAFLSPQLKTRPLRISTPRSNAGRDDKGWTPDTHPKEWDGLLCSNR